MTIMKRGIYSIGDKVEVKRNAMPTDRGVICKFLDFVNGKFWVGIDGETSSYWAEPQDCTKIT
jgi:hypothetical protein